MQKKRVKRKERERGGSKQIVSDIPKSQLIPRSQASSIRVLQELNNDGHNKKREICRTLIPLSPCLPSQWSRRRRSPTPTPSQPPPLFFVTTSPALAPTSPPASTTVAALSARWPPRLPSRPPRLGRWRPSPRALRGSAPSTSPSARSMWRKRLPALRCTPSAIPTTSSSSFPILTTASGRSGSFASGKKTLKPSLPRSFLLSPFSGPYPFDSISSLEIFDLMYI